MKHSTILITIKWFRQLLSIKTPMNRYCVQVSSTIFSYYTHNLSFYSFDFYLTMETILRFRSCVVNTVIQIFMACCDVACFISTDQTPTIASKFIKATLQIAAKTQNHFVKSTWQTSGGGIFLRLRSTQHDWSYLHFLCNQLPLSKQKNLIIHPDHISVIISN